ncbi:hypothetical protein Tco_0180758 [Tanacetum coccineum]
MFEKDQSLLQPSELALGKKLEYSTKSKSKNTNMGGIPSTKFMSKFMKVLAYFIKSLFRESPSNKTVLLNDEIIHLWSSTYNDLDILQYPDQTAFCGQNPVAMLVTPSRIPNSDSSHKTPYELVR